VFKLDDMMFTVLKDADGHSRHRASWSATYTNTRVTANGCVRSQGVAKHLWDQNI